jgi:hypothetical protein
MRPPALNRTVALILLLAPAPATSAGPPAPPRFLTDLRETARVVRLHDSTLLAVFTRTTANGPELVARPSRDNGTNWGPVTTLTALPPGKPGWSGAEPLVDRSGELHVFFLQSREKRPAGLDIDIYHMRSYDGRTRWKMPRRVWEGYTGALNCVSQMSTGRILLPFSYQTARSWARRGDGFEAFTYRGTFDSTVLFSDDGGESWHLSKTPLRVTVPDLGTEGAIEPVVAQRRDGRVWMLIRTQQGRFYESLSADGASWSRPQPTRILSSDSPAGLVRLSDGRLVLFWNNCLRFPYAYGGRHVLHGAVSSDDGMTWRGFREVAKNPRRDEPPPPVGDHGATYPIPCPVNDNKVITTTGLPEPNYNLFVDPDWLEETSRTEDFGHGLGEWSAFGVKGVGLRPHPQVGGRQVLSVRKAEPDWPAGAVWNFPAGLRGSLQLRVWLNPGFAGARLSLTDHFSVPYDELDEFANLVTLPVAPDGAIGAGSKAPLERWFELGFEWDTVAGRCTVTVDGDRVGTLPVRRETLGVCYLRIVSTSGAAGDGGLLVERVGAHVEPAGR